LSIVGLEALRRRIAPALPLSEKVSFYFSRSKQMDAPSVPAVTEKGRRPPLSSEKLSRRPEFRVSFPADISAPGIRYQSRKGLTVQRFWDFAFSPTPMTQNGAMACFTIETKKSIFI
jgi:hypothetical protein